jgi:hypothetical protein
MEEPHFRVFRVFRGYLLRFSVAALPRCVHRSAIPESRAFRARFLVPTQTADRIMAEQNHGQARHEPAFSYMILSCHDSVSLVAAPLLQVSAVSSGVHHGCGSAALGSLRLIRPGALRSSCRTSGLLVGIVQNLDLLAGDENSPAIGGQSLQLHRVQLLNSPHERFADPMPAIQHFSRRRENDGVAQIARVDVSGVFRDCSAGRKDVPWPAEPPDLVKASQLTQPHSLDRESFGQLPELVHPPETHRAVRSGRFAAAA